MNIEQSSAALKAVDGFLKSQGVRLGPNSTLALVELMVVALATQPPQDERGQGLSAFDAAVSAELPCVSTAQFNSHEICKWFAANVRRRILETGQDMSKESFEAMLLDDSDSPELLEKRKSDALETDAQRYRHLRGCRGMEHDPLFSVRDEEGNVLWGGDLDHEIDESIMYARDIYGDLPAAAPNVAEPAQPVALSTLTDEQIDAIWEELPDCDSIANYDDQRRFARAILAASAPAQQATPPQPVAAEVAKDAQRYRWLRDLPIAVPTNGLDVAWWDDYHGEGIRGEKLDAAIDAALAGTGSDESKKGEA